MLKLTQDEIILLKIAIRDYRKNRIPDISSTFDYPENVRQSIYKSIENHITKCDAILHKLKELELTELALSRVRK